MDPMGKPGTLPKPLAFSNQPGATLAKVLALIGTPCPKAGSGL